MSVESIWFVKGGYLHIPIFSHSYIKLRPLAHSQNTYIDISIPFLQYPIYLLWVLRILPIEQELQLLIGVASGAIREL